MKFFKLFALLFTLSLLASCIKNEPLDQKAEVNVDTEVRATCLDRLTTQLGVMVDVSNTAQANPVQGNLNNLLISWQILLDIVFDCNRGMSPQTIGDLENLYGKGCEKIEPGVAITGDPNLSAACPNAVEAALARANCYLVDWEATGGDPLDGQNFEIAFCDYLVLLNTCFDFGINTSGYCVLLQG